MNSNENKTAKLANHRKFYDATLSTPFILNEAQEIAIYAETELAKANSTETKAEVVANDEAKTDKVDTPDTANELKAEPKPKENAMAIAIDRDEKKMTIAITQDATKGKTKKYLVDGCKSSKAKVELVIQSYLREAIDTGATVQIDKRLANEFVAIADTPYKGEFNLVYTDNNGQPVQVVSNAQGEFVGSVDPTHYHFEIKMYGNKIPLFDIFKNGRLFIGSLSQSRMNKWIINAYQMRKKYPNMTIEVPRVVAALHLDSLACNPRIVRELNIALTEDIKESTNTPMEIETVSGAEIKGVDTPTTSPTVLVEIDDFDYRLAEEHLENVYADLQLWIVVCAEKHGLTQEQSEQIYIALHANNDFNDIDYSLRDKLIADYKKINLEQNELPIDSMSEAEIKSANSNDYAVTVEAQDVIADDAKTELANTTNIDSESKEESKLTIVKFKAGKTYFLPCNVDTDPSRIKRYYIAKRTAKTIVLSSGERCKSFIRDGIEVAEVSYGVYIYADDVCNESAIKAQAENNLVLPSGEHTVSSGAEAFALVTPYFPNGLSFDSIDYGYRGETHFCFCNESSSMSVVAMSDEDNSRIEAIEVVDHNKNDATFDLHYPLLVRIVPKKKVASEFNTAVVVEDTKLERNSDQRAKEEVSVKKSKKAKATFNKADKWLENAKISDEGRYYIVPELSYAGFDANANWNPCFYIVTAELKLKRIGLKFAVELAKLGQAIEISKEALTTIA